MEIKEATIEETTINEEPAASHDWSEPYVGPRKFEPQDWFKFFGRERETRELIGRIISGRVVLFRAPSGAGKSSLLNTRIIPELENRGFDVLPVARVSGHTADNLAVENVFVYHLLSSLLDEDEEHPQGMEKMTLAHFLDHLLRENGTYRYDSNASEIADSQGPRVLIIDQFEEILTTSVADWDHRERFFIQLGEALANDRQLWLLLAMRQDFVDGLSRYLHHLPDGEPVPYPMEHLNYEEALDAICRPVDGIRKFEAGAAKKLATNLMIKKSSTNTEYKTEFIEPLQLQTVCYQLWRQLQQHPGDTITAQDIDEFADIAKALENFYEETITETVKSTGVDEGDLRRWFEEDLITKEGQRNLVRRGVENAGSISRDVAEVVARSLILHEVRRSDAVWYELVHDRFVEPIRVSNRAWQDRWRLDRFGRLVTGAFVFMLIVFAAVLLNYRNQAISVEATATIQGLDHEANLQANEAQQRLSDEERLQKAYNAVRLTYDFDKTVTSEAAAALYSILAESNERLEIKSLGGYDERVLSVDFSPDGAHILTTGDDGTVRLWDGSGKPVELDMRDNSISDEILINSALFSPDGKQILTTSYDRSARLWDREGNLLYELSGHDDWVNGAAFSRDGRMIVTASDDRIARVWNSSDGQLSLVLEGHKEPVRSAAFSPDGTFVVTASDDGTARLWDIVSDAEAVDLIGHQAFVTQAEFSPDGQRIITASMDFTARLWDRNGELINVLEGHTAPVRVATYGPGGQSIVTASDDGSWRLWDREGKPITRLDWHTAPVNDIAFSQDGTKIATASDDRTTKVGWFYPDIETMLAAAESMLVQDD